MAQQKGNAQGMSKGLGQRFPKRVSRSPGEARNYSSGGSEKPKRNN
jgi:hypothetical protein